MSKIDPKRAREIIAALKANVFRHFDLRRQMVEAKDELSLLQQQWADLGQELYDADLISHLDWICNLDPQDNVTKTCEEWEQRNPGWITVGNSVRRIKPKKGQP